jgi:hypothetical protein
MNECSQRPTDPFLVTGERWIDDMVLHFALKSLDDKNFYELKFEKRDPVQKWKEKEDHSPLGGLRNENTRTVWWKSFHKRVLIATFGGFLLLGPMWLMVLHHTVYTALISTTVCVTFFGLVMCYYLDKEMDVLSATAAYAAVLVVFVGLNTSSG